VRANFWTACGNGTVAGDIRCFCLAMPVKLQDPCGHDASPADNFLQKTTKTALIVFQAVLFV
jgi:hypothetical protein